MRYRALDRNGDFIFGRNMQSFLLQADAVAQAILTRLRQLRGEWWEDLEDGLPLFQDILGQRKAIQVIDQIYKDRILGTKNVRSILEYESTWDNSQRAYSFSARVDTVFGEVELSEVKF